MSYKTDIFATMPAMTSERRVTETFILLEYMLIVEFCGPETARMTSLDLCMRLARFPRIDIRVPSARLPF